MSIAIDAVNEYIRLLANSGAFPSGLPSNAFTFYALFAQDTDLNAAGSMMYVASADGNSVADLHVKVDGTTGVLSINYGADGADIATVGVSPTFKRAALVGRDAAGTPKLISYIGSTASGEVTNTLYNITQFLLGSNYGACVAGKFSAVRIWNTNLSAAELNAEDASPIAVKTANLLMDVQMGSNATTLADSLIARVGVAPFDQLYTPGAGTPAYSAVNPTYGSVGPTISGNAYAEIIA